MKRIRARHPVREAFSGNSSGARYYDYKGEAVEAFNSSLEDYGFCLDFSDCNDWYGDEGRRTVAILTVESDSSESTETGSHAHFTWYRTGSGRWEIIGYIN